MTTINRAQAKSMNVRWSNITRPGISRDEYISEDPPYILLMLCDEYDEPVYKRLIESQVDGLTPTERNRLEYECIFGP